MSKIDAETLGDAAVKEAREALKTVLDDEGSGTNSIKDQIDKIKVEVGKADSSAGQGITKDTVTTAATAIKTAIEGFKGKEEFNKLSDTVKAELTALESLATNLDNAAKALDTTATNNKPGGEKSAETQKFIDAFNEFDKVYTSLKDLNAAQTADLNEMRTKLQSFVASPEDAKTKLDSTNFTAFIDTLDTALSKISDQRAKLG